MTPAPPTPAGPAEIAADLGLRLDPQRRDADESGWDFVVLHALDAEDRRWIIRVPRRDSVVDLLPTEAALLRLVSRRLPVAVPQWRRSGDVVAYPRLDGAPAAAEHPRTLRYRWRMDPLAPAATYVRSLARCLARLHAVSTGDVLAAGLPPREMADVRQHLRDKLCRVNLEVGVPEPCLDRWRQWLDTDRGWPPRTVLTHGDVHPGHTMVDADGRLAGIIDWTNGGLGDPAIDFIDMAYAGGAALRDSLIRAYLEGGAPGWPGMRRHVAVRASFIWVTVALGGLLRDRPHHVDLARRRMARAAARGRLPGAWSAQPVVE